MATLIVNEEVFEVEGTIMDACMDAGIPFGCQTGQCGTCTVEVVQGMEHLSPRTQAEVDMELEANQRLACQCKIKQGTVKIKEV